MIKLLYKKSDIVISNSQGNANDLIDNFGIPRHKMKVINNPIDLEKIARIDPLNDFFDKQKFNIVTLGRLDIGKNHAMLIRTLGQLKNTELRLYIFGVGNMKTELESLIEKLNLTDQVILMGFDPNPYKYLKAADLFVFSSNHEGFPNVLLEAMSCGLSILTTNCQSGPSEIMELKTVENDIMKTDYGILVPIKNAELMAKGINYFVSNKGFLNNCKVRVLKRAEDFRKNKILKEYIDVISSTNYAK